MLARGYIYFDDADKEALKQKNLVRAVFEFDGRPGVFIHGDTNLSAKELVDQFREFGKLHADVSVEPEDTVIHLKEGSFTGTYRGIRLSDYDIEDLKSRLNDYDGDVVLRTVEKKDGKPLLCIDLIGKEVPEIGLAVQQIGFTLE
ncbi:MAG: hypothetical protein R6V53_05685 [Candidatus Woesearchaeota archaeon]